MKYAVMSDVHANPQALEAALADARAQGCAKFVLLGDVTGYGYDVETALKMVRETFDVVLMGNHDAVCVGLRNEDYLVQVNPHYDLDRAQGKALDDEAKAWLRQRPYVWQEGAARGTHGDFTEPEEWFYVMNRSDALENFEATSERVLFCGHTHHADAWRLTEQGKVLQYAFGQYLADPVWNPEEEVVEIHSDSRYLINCGSVGYPRADPFISYAIWDADAPRVIMRRLPFDLGSYCQALVAKGIPVPVWLQEIC